MVHRRWPNFLFSGQLAQLELSLAQHNPSLYLNMYQLQCFDKILTHFWPRGTLWQPPKHTSLIPFLNIKFKPFKLFVLKSNIEEFRLRIGGYLFPGWGLLITRMKFDMNIRLRIENWGWTSITWECQLGLYKCFLRTYAGFLFEGGMVSRV